jgi:ankyrin repeat protein
VTRLLAAENRYGQTVLHIAARKGCRELLQLLLLYGAGQVAGRVADAAGDTPLDIARRHGHEMAVRELLAQCRAGHRGADSGSQSALVLLSVVDMQQAVTSL